MKKIINGEVWYISDPAQEDQRWMRFVVGGDCRGSVELEIMTTYSVAVTVEGVEDLMCLPLSFDFRDAGFSNVRAYPDEGKIVATKELEADSKANAFCEVMRQAWTICPDGDVTGKSLTEDGVDS